MIEWKNRAAVLRCEEVVMSTSDQGSQAAPGLGAGSAASKAMHHVVSEP